MSYMRDSDGRRLDTFAVAPKGVLVAGVTPPRKVVGSGLLQLNTSALLVTATERDRLLVILRNLDATQTLRVAHGILDSSTAPSTFTDVAPGQEWASTDVRPVFAYYVTSGALVHVYKELI